MWALIGGLDAELGTLNAPQSVQGAELAPNLALLDPRNTAANSARYALDGMAWLQGDALQNVAAEASDDDDVSGGDASSGTACGALQRLARRYALGEAAATLLQMLRAAFVDSEMKVRTRQFWAALEAGAASDFELLAHLTIAAREAQLASGIALAQPHAAVERACFAAARREWDAGRVGASTGAVFALLLLSEYGFQIGDTALLWEFAHSALATARRIELRGRRFPWRGARGAACDVAYEHVLASYWSSWARVLTAAQTTARRVDAALFARDAPLPEFPQHDMCHYTAQPVAAPGAPRFAPAACAHRAHFAYSAATWRCSLLSAEMHNLHVDVLERRCAPDAYVDALRAWDARMQAWRAAWPREWHAQLDEMLAVARRVNAARA
ncbi:hypothetical protein H4S02_012922, partial [Coemansia sp. RSA 2611]